VATPLDVLYLSDLRFPGGTSSSLVEEVRAATAAGYRVGALHCESSSLRADRTFHPGVRALLKEGLLELVVPGEDVRCGLAVVKHPTVMVDGLEGRLPIEADHVIAVVGQVPEDADGSRYYDPPEVQANIADALGASPEWWPVSPTVRRHLAGADVPLADTDWVEVIDVEAWRVERSGPIGAVPVIGRHGRPSRLKWPADPLDLLAAYPDDDAFRVRVLGGTDGLEEVLGELPAGWEVLPFGSMDAREFLAGVDVFVYFHHHDLVEAFGRTVLEALAAGCAVVLPHHFSELFGDACLYAEPSEVPELVRRLHADGLVEQSDVGRAAVSERFSHASHVARISSLVGPPIGATGRDAPSAIATGGLADRRPRILVSCIGSDGPTTAGVVSAVTGHRDLATGFTPVVVTTVTGPELAVHLGEGVDLLPKGRAFATERGGVRVEVLPARRDHGGDERWEDLILRCLAEIVRRQRIDSVVPADPSHPDAWLVLQVSPYRR